MKKINFYLLCLFVFSFSQLFAAHLSGSLQLTARMNGLQSVPAVTTDAEGLGIFTLDASKKNLLVDISVSGLSGGITGIHIHEGAPGTNGGVVYDLTPFVNGNRVQTTLRDIADVEKFLSGAYYVNVHTAANPGGEIRAQILLESDFRFTASLDGSQEVPAVATNAFGLGVFNLSKSGYKLQIKAVVTGLSGPITGAHLHQGGVGMNGGVVEDLTAAVDGNVITAVVDPSDYIDALKAGEIYLNIHTADHPGGEIRGQVVLAGGLYFDAFLDGAQSVPAVATTAQGVASVTVSNDLSMLTYDIVIDGLSGPITGAHFHAGTVGNSGDVLVNLTNDIVGNRISGTFSNVSIDLLNQMLSGGVYINIHTADHPGGEIRGQVYKLAREGYVFDFSGGQSVPATDSPGTGAGMVTIDRDQTNAHFMMVVSGLMAGIDAAHFHNGRPGETGDVIFDLTGFFNPTGGAYGYWTEQDMVMPFSHSPLFRNNAVYVNIHTSVFPAGEIRANVVRGSNFFNVLPTDPHFTNDLLCAAKLTGDAEVPSVVTDAIGVASFLLNSSRDEIEVNVSVNGVSGPITGIHVHEGAPDENGPVVFDLSPGIVGNRVKSTLTGFSSEQLARLLHGDYYLNIHTDANPGGEIRGQIQLETDITYRADLDGDQEVPAVATDAFGLATFNYTKVVNQLEINVLVSGLSGPITGAHLHNAPPGMNGGVVEDLTGFVRGNRIQGIVFPGDYLDELEAGNIYINIHTDANPGGEIRGQLILDNALTFDTWLDGAQAVPASTSIGAGFAAVRLSPDFNQVSYDVVFENMSSEVIAAHFHSGGLGEAGGVLLDISGGIDGQRIKGIASAPEVTSDLIDALLTGGVYINLHTPGFPAGEIRGQLFRLARDGYGYDLCPKQSTTPVNAPEATGGGMASIDRNNSNAHVMVVYSGLTGDMVSAHIHQGMEGEDGDVLVDLTSGFKNGGLFTYLKGDDFNRSIASDIKNQNAYINIHTNMHPGGEIRGQIIKELVCELPVGTIDFLPHVNEVTLSPVPADDLLTIRYNLESPVPFNASVVNVLGHAVWQQEISNTAAGTFDISVDVSTWSPGMYFFVLGNGEKVTSIKFVVE